MPLGNEDENATKAQLPVFRFKFSDHFTQILAEFSKVHQYDDRKLFKASWEKWIKNENITKTINYEIVNLKQRGFDGDTLDKMFKSARYYFRKKSVKEEVNKEKPKEKKNKHYVEFSQELLLNIDNHIKKELLNKKKPSESYENYCNENKEAILREIILFKKRFETIDTEELKNKFKKTYKNRYYNFARLKNAKV
jgi:hypothetical protein